MAVLVWGLSGALRSASRISRPERLPFKAEQAYLLPFSFMPLNLGAGQTRLL
ncbi:MAG: hypothetical protein ACLFPA_04935 [Dichotomicrobium sp.]